MINIIECNTNIIENKFVNLTVYDNAVVITESPGIIYTENKLLEIEEL